MYILSGRGARRRVERGVARAVNMKSLVWYRTQRESCRSAAALLRRPPVLSSLFPTWSRGRCFAQVSIFTPASHPFQAYEPALSWQAFQLSAGAAIGTALIVAVSCVLAAAQARAHRWCSEHGANRTATERAGPNLGPDGVVRDRRRVRWVRPLESYRSRRQGWRSFFDEPSTKGIAGGAELTASQSHVESAGPSGLSN